MKKKKTALNFYLYKGHCRISILKLYCFSTIDWPIEIKLKTTCVFLYTSTLPGTSDSIFCMHKGIKAREEGAGGWGF